MTTPLMIDTHCHLNFDRYENDLSEVLQRATDAGVTRTIIPAVDLQTAEESLKLAEQYEGIFVAVGVHPNSTAEFDENIITTLEQLTSHEKVVAIGEIGLDYYWDKSPKDKQAAAFKTQLELAAKLELPVIIHNREASDDVMDILEAWATTLPDSLKNRPGVMHSFSAPAEIAERALAAGFYLGFTGPITFKKAEDLRDVAATVPMNRILVETDGPFLTPHPYRSKRNEPAYIPYIVDRLSGLKQVTAAEMAQHTTENALRLFELSD